MTPERDGVPPAIERMARSEQAASAAAHGMVRAPDSVGQLLRFGLVGLKSNFVYYLLYLAVTALGVGAQAAVTIVFVVGILYSFLFNRRLVFRHDGSIWPTFTRYVAVYLAAWALNLACLELLVSRLGVDHRIAQAALMLGIGALLFLALKYFVFRARTGRST